MTEHGTHEAAMAHLKDGERLCAACRVYEQARAYLATPKPAQAHTAPPTKD